MNYVQLGLFIIYFLSTLCAGAAVVRFFRHRDELSERRLIHQGELFMLGSILLIGQLILVSLLGWYSRNVLWSVVVLQFGFLLFSGVRTEVSKIFYLPRHWDLPRVIFVVFLAVFIFRNYYFLVDVDSHSTYLYAQKLWLSHGTSIYADRGIDTRSFVSHLDCVPYGLGISLLGKECLIFCQLINVLWRVVVLSLVFGYAEYRLGSLPALAAALFVMLNDHFFISGANQSVLISGAAIAFVFAAAYNFWEARTHNSVFRFLLALICASQFVPNKYQLAFTFIFFMAVGLFIYGEPLRALRGIFANKNWLIVLLVAYLVAAFWPLKNYLSTGDPIYPILAGKFHVAGSSPEMDHAFSRVFGGSTPMEFLKYMNYFFVWPGINCAKFVVIVISSLPFLCFLLATRNKLQEEEFKTLCFWLGMSILVLMGTILGSHPDPRYFRYGIGVMAFAAVFSLQYIFKNIFLIKNEILVGLLVVLLSLPGIEVISQSGGSQKRPTFQDNVDVILNKKHERDIIPYFYPQNVIVDRDAAAHLDQVKESVWFEGVGGVTKLSAFLLPVIRPQTGLWYTTIVRWESYASEEAIAKDIREYGVKWIMNGEKEMLVFLSPEEYARQAVHFPRYPKQIFYPYDLVPEITSTGY